MGPTGPQGIGSTGATGPTGPASFIGQADTPNSYGDYTQSILHVNSAGTGVEFTRVAIDNNSQAMWGWIRKVNTPPQNYTLGYDDTSRANHMTSDSPQVITLPNQATLWLPTGWFSHIIRVGAGTISFVAQTPDSIHGLTSVASQWDVVEIYLAVSGGAPGIANQWIIRKI
jgi:hypothetical protein